MREAFTYMFKDPGYDKKAITYFVICLCSLALTMSPELANITTPNFAEAAKVAKPSNPIFTFLPIIGNFFSLLLAGYHLNCVEAITKQNQNIVLPFFNLATAFVRGIKNVIASLFMTLVFVIVGGDCLAQSACGSGRKRPSDPGLRHAGYHARPGKGGIFGALRGRV